MALRLRKRIDRVCERMRMVVLGCGLLNGQTEELHIQRIFNQNLKQIPEGVLVCF